MVIIMKKRKTNIAIYIALFLVMAITEMSIMLILDMNKYRLSCIPHSFKGEAWFSVIATILASVPGTFCGVLALIQTQRLHAIEDWYRRPILIMREAKLGLLLCGSSKFQYTRYTAKERDYFETVKEKFTSQDDYEGILSLKLQFELQSDPVIHKVEIESINFVFPGIGEDYLLKVADISSKIKDKGGERYAFHSRYENGRVCYKVSSDIYAGQKLESIKFWNTISGFIDHANQSREEYRIMDTKVSLKVYHEYALKGYDVLLLDIHWKANEKNTRKETYMEQVSIESICSYI